MRTIFTLTERPVNSFFYCFLSLLLFLNVQNAVAQDNPNLYREIQLSKKSYHFDELTHVIQQQTGLTFSYNTAQISSVRKFKIRTNRITLIKLLGIIKKESGIHYQIIKGKHIVYLPPGNAIHKIHRQKKHFASEKQKPQKREQLTFTC